MPAKLTRREALRAAAAAGAAGGLVTSATADDRGRSGDRGNGRGNGDGGPPERIVGTTRERGSRAARDEAESVRRTLEFGGIGQAVSGRFSDEAAERLRRRDDVRYVEDNGEMRALEQTTPYGISTVEADVAVDGGSTGAGVSVAVIDSGIDAGHEDLQANLGEGYAASGAACDANCGGSTCGGNGIDKCRTEWDDDNDHGSHVAGTAGAVDNATGVLGVAPDATLHAVKVLDCCGSGSFDDIAAGIKWSADQGHDVQNMSLGASSGSSALKDAIRYAADRGVVMVAAAGNDGPCTDCVGYPAAYEEVVAVSATDRNDDLASFSSTGPEIELAAPGVDVESTVPRDGYERLSGTSMASPHVAGGAAQVVAAGVTGRTQIRQELKSAADDVGLGADEQGAGRLNVDEAVGGIEGVAVLTDGADGVGETTATLNGTLSTLDGADSADVYFEWGPAGDRSNATAVRTRSSTGSFGAELTGLEVGTDYEFRAVAEGSDGTADAGAVATFRTDGGCVDAAEWPAGTGRDGGENIDELDLDGQVVATSGSDAYEDATCPDVVTVAPGGSFEVAMAWSDGGYDGHYASVHVDWPQNGDWSQADGTALMRNAGDDGRTATATVDVPSGAPTGETLVRVRLSWDGFDAPGATDEYGEVNDFTVAVE